MIRTALLLFLSAASGVTLATDYGAKRVQRIESTTELRLETVELEVLRDGQRMETPFGGASSEESRRAVVLERVLRAVDGTPREVRREFDTVEGTVARSFGDMDREDALECPLDGVTLLLRGDDDGDVDVEVVAGDRPGDELLEGHRLELAADAIFPDDSVEVGAIWDLGPEAVQRLLGLDVLPALFPPPARAGGFGGGRGEGGRGGRGFGGRGRNVLGVLRDAEWSGTAVLETVDEEGDGERCARIELSLRASGDLPEPSFGGRDGGRMPLGPEALRPAPDNVFEVELEGHLLFGLETKRPVALEVEGRIELETGFVRDRGETSFEMHSRQEGTFSHAVEVTVTDEP